MRATLPTFLPASERSVRPFGAAHGPPASSEPDSAVNFIR